MPFCFGGYLQAQSAKLEADLSAERQRAAEKDRLLSAMQDQLAQLEALVAQQAEEAQVEQERLSSLEQSLAHREEAERAMLAKGVLEAEVHDLKGLLASESSKRFAVEQKARDDGLEQQRAFQEWCEHQKQRARKMSAEIEGLLLAKSELEAEVFDSKACLVEEQQQSSRLHADLEAVVHAKQALEAELHNLQGRLAEEILNRNQREHDALERERLLREKHQCELQEQQRQQQGQQQWQWQQQQQQQQQQQLQQRGQGDDKTELLLLAKDGLDQEVRELKSQLTEELSKRKKAQYEVLERERLLHEKDQHLLAKDQQIIDLQAKLDSELRRDWGGNSTHSGPRSSDSPGSLPHTSDDMSSLHSGIHTGAHATPVVAGSICLGRTDADPPHGLAHSASIGLPHKDAICTSAPNSASHLATLIYATGAEGAPPTAPFQNSSCVGQFFRENSWASEALDSEPRMVEGISSGQSQSVRTSTVMLAKPTASKVLVSPFLQHRAVQGCLTPPVLTPSMSAPRSVAVGSPVQFVVSPGAHRVTMPAYVKQLPVQSQLVRMRNAASTA